MVSQKPGLILNILPLYHSTVIKSQTQDVVGHTRKGTKLKIGNLCEMQSLNQRTLIGLIVGCRSDSLEAGHL